MTYMKMQIEIQENYQWEWGACRVLKRISCDGGARSWDGWKGHLLSSLIQNYWPWLFGRRRRRRLLLLQPSALTEPPMRFTRFKLLSLFFETSNFWNFNSGLHIPTSFTYTPPSHFCPLTFFKMAFMSLPFYSQSFFRVRVTFPK